MPILRNSCLNCHNADKNKAGLDMTTYQGMMDGSDTRKVVTPGNSGNSVLFKCVAHLENPSMPPKSDKLPDSQIEVLRKWIDGGALETADSKAMIAQDSGPALQLFADDKADGPAPVPRDLLLEPVQHTVRAGSVVSMAASPRAPFVAIAAQKQVLVYNADTQELVGVLPFPEGFPEVVKFSRDGHYVIAGGGIGAKSGKVVVWDVTTGLRVMEAGDEFDAVLAADISPDRHYIALGGPNKMVKIFKDGKLLFSIKKHTDWVTALAFTADGKMLVSGDRQGGLVVWETSSGTEMFTLTNHKGGVTSLACPGPLTAISASEDGSVKFWDLREGKEMKTWDAHKPGVLSVAFSPDGKIVTAGRDKIVRLWNSDGTKLKEFEPFKDVALSAVIAGDKVVAGDWTGAVRIWDTQGKRLAEWAPNPPMLAERVAEVTARLANLQATQAKTAALLADAQKAADKSGADAVAAAQSAADKEKAWKTAQAQVATLQKSSSETDAAVKKLTADVAQLQSVTQGLNADLTKAVAANDTAQHAQADGNMQEKQARAAQLAEAAKAAQAAADKQPNDKNLADAAAKAKADADKAEEDLAGDQKSSSDGDAQRAKDALAKANDAVSANKDAVDAAQAKLKEQTAAAQKLHTDLATAKTALATAKTDYDAVAAALPPKAAQAKDAELKFSKAKQDAEQLVRDLATAKGDAAKWKAAQLNITLIAYKKDLADRTAERQKAVDAASQGLEEYNKAQADLTAAQKTLADSPARIKAAEEALAQATQARSTAAASANSKKDESAQKVKAASDAVDKLAAKAATAPDDTAARDALAKARMALEVAKRAGTGADDKSSAAAADLAKADQNVAAAEKTLAQAKGDAAALPAQVAKLQSDLNAIASRTTAARAVAAKAGAAFDKSVAVAKAKVDALTKDYEALLKQAEEAYKPVAVLTKK